MTCPPFDPARRVVGSGHAGVDVGGASRLALAFGSWSQEAGCLLPFQRLSRSFKLGGWQEAAPAEFASDGGRHVPSLGLLCLQLFARPPGVWDAGMPVSGPAHALCPGPRGAAAAYVLGPRVHWGRVSCSWVAPGPSFACFCLLLCSLVVARDQVVLCTRPFVRRT